MPVFATLDVSYLDVERDQPVLQDVDLANFDVVLLSGEGLFFITEEDFLKLKKFVDVIEIIAGS